MKNSNSPTLSALPRFPHFMVFPFNCWLVSLYLPPGLNLNVCMAIYWCLHCRHYHLTSLSLLPTMHVLPITHLPGIILVGSYIKCLLWVFISRLSHVVDEITFLQNFLIPRISNPLAFLLVISLVFSLLVTNSTQILLRTLTSILSISWPALSGLALPYA